MRLDRAIWFVFVAWGLWMMGKGLIQWSREPKDGFLSTMLGLAFIFVGGLWCK